jgi:hypothetical protein
MDMDVGTVMTMDANMKINRFIALVVIFYQSNPSTTKHYYYSAET